MNDEGGGDGVGIGVEDLRVDLGSSMPGIFRKTNRVGRDSFLRVWSYIQ